jgi:hypothetical protein
VGAELVAPVVSDAARDANVTDERGVNGRARSLTKVADLRLLRVAIRAWESEDAATLDLLTLLVEGEVAFVRRRDRGERVGGASSLQARSLSGVRGTGR